MTKEEIRQEALKAEKERFPRCAGDKENSFHGVNSGYGLGFVDGALWVCDRNKSPWISVEDDLPCNHGELMSQKEVREGTETIDVFAASKSGLIWNDYMMYENGKWRWNGNNFEPDFWMLAPKLPKE